MFERFTRRKQRFGEEVDVVVIGTGGAGLVAALAAADGGARVALLEKSQLVGGTTAVSGGVVWVPQNHHMAEAGVSDSREDALGYLRLIADGRTDDALLERYVDEAPKMARWLEDKTPLRFVALGHYPDYHPEHPGGKPGGRSMETGLFQTAELGAWAKALRRSPIFGATPMTVTEATEWGVFSKPLSLPYGELAKRYKAGYVCYGASLVGNLLAGCLAAGVEPRLGISAQALVQDEQGRVIGVEAVGPGEDGAALSIGARRGVILASGGFEWDPELRRHFLGGQLTHPNSPPISHGDGLRMAMSVGADLGNMSEAWWCPSVVVPGEDYDGVQLNRGDFAIRSLPHSIIVNRAGRRFVNEAHNYNDMMKPFFDFDPVAYQRPNLPAWLVLDQAFVERYLLVTSVPGMEPPAWIPRAETLEGLAATVGIDAAGLAETVARFNGFAREGVDRDFRRGESVYDHFYGDPDHQPNPNLGTLERGPFYAIEVHPGAIGTKGGPLTTRDAQVKRPDGGVIEGLYAAGNVMAGITGPGYPGAGATIGTAMTWGWLAGRHAAARKVE
ncbi:MAG: FAD-dependent oxidoreductase [Deltaproteobacteria bacterium]|nr:FAD-dependent oxidoreductase [Deltaproteobacteria bacterium]